MSNFMPAGESDFDSGDEYDMFEPGVYSTHSKTSKNVSTINTTHDVVLPLATAPPSMMPADKTNASTSVLKLQHPPVLRIPSYQNNEIRSAIIYGDTNIFEKLISTFQTPDMLLRCDWTPLMYACYFAQPEITEICLRRGADVNYAIQDGSTPLLKACQSPKSEDDVVKCVEHLVINNVQLLKTDEKEKSCLIIAAREGKLKLLQLILQLATSDIKKNLIELCDCSGWNALDWAVAKEHFGCAKELMGQGATASLSKSELLIKSGEETLLKVWPKSANSTDNSSGAENENKKDNDCEKVGNEVKPEIYDENKNICVENTKTEADDVPSGDFVNLKTPHAEVKFATSEDITQKSIFEEIEQQVIPHEEEYIPPQPVLKEDAVNEEVGDYIEYGQLELFLHGLDLSHITPIFHQHDIRFEQLLCLTMKDLETIGIRQLGVRKRILNAVHQCHTEQWANTSTPDFTERAMSVDEIVQVLTNLEEHSRYMASSIRFIELKIKSFPEILHTPANEQIKKPHRHEMLEKIHDLIPSLHKLCRATKNLDICLMKQALPDSVDFVQPPTKIKRSFITRTIPVALLSIGCFMFYKLKTN